MKGPVCVTGAGGFIASHTVSQLLSKGYTVHGTVRDPQSAKNAHLLSLPHAAERLKLFAADLSDPRAFDAPIAGCTAVIHMATAVLLGGADDGKKQIFDPGMQGLRSVLDSAEKAATVPPAQFGTPSPPEPQHAIRSSRVWSGPEPRPIT